MTMNIKPRDKISLRRSLSAFLIGVGIAFGIGACLLLILGKNPILAYQTLFLETFSSTNKLIATFVDFSPLLMVALGLSIAFRCGFWNIGAEGQYIAGIIFATWLGVRAGGIPQIFTIPLMILFGFIGGGLLGLLPVVLKIKRGVNEVFTTLMLNFIINYVALYLIGTVWRRAGSPYPETEQIAQSAKFPILVQGTTFHLGVLVSIFFVVVVYLLIFKTTLGYKIRAAGINPGASAVKGISVGRIIFLAVFISGGLAGVYHRTTYETVQLGIGYLGILIAFLGRNHPLWIAVASFFYGVLLVGGEGMTMVIGVPRTFTFVLQILVLLLIIFMDRLAHYEIKLRGR